MRKKSKIEKIIKKFNSMPEFEIHITEEETKIVGKETEIVTGLSVLVNYLKESGVDERIIKYAVKLGLNFEEESEKTLKALEIFDLDID